MGRKEVVDGYKCFANFPDRGPESEGKMPVWNVPDAEDGGPTDHPISRYLVEWGYLSRALDLLLEREIEVNNLYVKLTREKKSSLNWRALSIVATVCFLAAVGVGLWLKYFASQAEHARQVITREYLEVYERMLTLQLANINLTQPPAVPAKVVATPVDGGSGAVVPDAGQTSSDSPPEEEAEEDSPSSDASAPQPLLRRKIVSRTPGVYDDTSGIKRNVIRRKIKPRAPGESDD